MRMTVDSEALQILAHSYATLVNVVNTYHSGYCYTCGGLLYHGECTPGHCLHCDNRDCLKRLAEMEFSIEDGGTI